MLLSHRANGFSFDKDLCFYVSLGLAIVRRVFLLRCQNPTTAIRSIAVLVDLVVEPGRVLTPVRV